MLNAATYEEANDDEDGEDEANDEHDGAFAGDKEDDFLRVLAREADVSVGVLGGWFGENID